MILSCLDALLIFLVGHKRMTGYDVRQLFQSSPVGLFSDSPGAIYPALARLEMRGLLTSEALPSGRRNRLYRRTAAGKSALTAWLTQPVDPEVLKRNAKELDLRFVMISGLLGDKAAQRFARECAAAYAEEVARLEAFRDGPGQVIGAASLKSLDLGIRIHRLRQRWCEEQVAEKTTQADTRQRKQHESRSPSRISRRVR